MTLEALLQLPIFALIGFGIVWFLMLFKLPRAGMVLFTFFWFRLAPLTDPDLFAVRAIFGVLFGLCLMLDARTFFKKKPAPAKGAPAAK